MKLLNKAGNIPHSLPLLTYLGKKSSLESQSPFRGYKILAVQHLLGSTVPFFNMLVKGGAKPNDIFIAGKAYSSHPLVVRQLMQSGYRLNFDSVFDFVEDQPYDSILEKHIIETCESLLKELGTNQKGLIIDDGGKAIRLLHDAYPHFTSRFSCVEQTSRGARVINSLELKCPVVNVARSDAKTLYESPSIAQGMVEEFINSLKLWEKSGVFKLTDKRILLSGYGFIGENVAEKLQKSGFKVIIYDTNESQLQKAISRGLSVTKNKNEIYGSVDILIGCTGMPVMGEEEFNLLKPGTLLVNMASTDMEFSAHDLRPKGEIVFQNILPSDRKYLYNLMPLSWRSLYKIRLSGTYIYLANGGFPSDFSGKINPIPLAAIQLTSALLLGGVIQAVEAGKPGFIDLDGKFQDLLVSEYLRLKSRNGLQRA